MKLLSLVALSAVSSAGSAPAPVEFNWFEYTGRDAVFTVPLAPTEYRNPIRAGFYPDPDICRVGDDYYSVNSSFAYYPGVPMFHSRDLVNWTQVGNVVDRPSQLNYDGLGVSRGIFAPALSHHGDTFYLVCTFVDAGGNFVMTARDAAGPWSDPAWLDFDGIDPSLFFDDDGSAWIVNNGPPLDNKPLYNGHRAIWLQKFDPAARKLVGPREVIVNGGSDLAKHPVWIEGPHLFKKDGWYYLMCAEGGTAEDHSEVIFRSRSVRGPYVAGPANPILTQRDLAADRPYPVTCTGHADLVQTARGEWWALFLGCRPYAANLYNTGRETFMLPVTWTDGWPVILPAGARVPYLAPSPAGAPPVDPNAVPFTGNFTWRDTFDSPSLSPLWVMLRQPHQSWWSTGRGARHLLLTPSAESLARGNPSFLGRRIQHARFEAATEVEVPSERGTCAGLMLFQNDQHCMFFGVRRCVPGEVGDACVFYEQHDGEHSGASEIAVRLGTSPVDLRVRQEGSLLKFEYATEPGAWKVLVPDSDATILSTQSAGGFVGAMVGPYARLNAR